MRLDILAAALSVGVLLVPLPGQQRRPLVGRVLDAAGAPVAAAEVTLVWSPPGGPECGTTDVIVCTTDERGHFVGKLLPQESYSAWAIATGADGRTRASAVREGAAAGGDLELRLELPAGRRPVQLLGASAWAAAGPLRVEVAPRAANLAGLPLDENGLCPPLPPLGCAFVRDAAGQVLFAQGLPRSGGEAGITIRLPVPRTMQLRVTDPTGAPIAGATVHHATAPSEKPLVDTDALFDRPGFQAWRRAGTTAADGSVTVLVPEQDSDHWWPLLVRSPGHAESTVVVTPSRPQQVHVDGAPTTLPLDAVIAVKLRRAARLRIVHEGAPLPRAEVMLTAGYAPQHLERVVALQLDDSGSCDLPIPLGPVETMLHVRRRPGEPWQLRRIDFRSGLVIKVDLSNQRRLSLQFLDENGGPARGLTGVLVAVGSVHAGGQQVIVSTDQAGRLERTVGGDAWLLFLTDGVRWKRFDIPRLDQPESAGEFVATIVCDLLETAKFRVLDPIGTPIAGARITAVLGGVARFVNDPAASQYAALRQRLEPRLVQRSASDPKGLLEVTMTPELVGAVRIEAPGHGQVDVRLRPGETTDVTLAPAIRPLRR